MRLTVRLFAGLRERAGRDRIEVELPDGATAADLLAAMDLPARSCVVAVNREYGGPGQRLAEGDEVALVPPVSGGAQEDAAPASPGSGGVAEGAPPAGERVRLARVTAEALDASALLDAVRDPSAGGIVLFSGVTRDVEALEYEAYAEMAEPRLAQIADEEAHRHGLAAVAVAHRTGRVALSEPSVLVAVSAPHRGEAFAGARAIIDRVKTEAPIWKVEVTAEGRTRVDGVLPPTG